jgi:hypothetical protein
MPRIKEAQSLNAGTQFFLRPLVLITLTMYREILLAAIGELRLNASTQFYYLVNVVWLLVISLFCDDSEVRTAVWDHNGSKLAPTSVHTICSFYLFFLFSLSPYCLILFLG